MVVRDLVGYHRNMVDAFKMEVSTEMLKQNKEAQKLARYINRFGKRVEKIEKLKKKLFE